MSDTSAIQVQGLVKYYGKTKAVDGIDFTVHKGEVCGFLGPNGAGKTTTIGMLLGLIRSTRGRIDLLGSPITPENGKVLKKVGALYGESGFVPYMNGYQNLLLLSHIYNGIKRATIDETLDLVGLTEHRKQSFKNYSTGMKRRLGIGAAILHHPELLILDEPMNGLDPAGMKEVRELIRSLSKMGVTIFLSSHLLHEVELICDQVLIIKNGKVIAKYALSQLQNLHLKRTRIAIEQLAPAMEMIQTLGSTIKATVEDGLIYVTGAANERIIEVLANKGLFPSEISYVTSSLEDSFLDLIK